MKTPSRTLSRYLLIAAMLLPLSACLDKETTIIQESTEGGNEYPRVVGAASPDNTMVEVSFNKAMSDNAEDASKYDIAELDGTSRLAISAASFKDGTRSTVMLTTASQNSVRYQLSVLDVRDEDGNTFDGGSDATFVGTPPDRNDLVDADGDGLLDNEEQLGWRVTVRPKNGQWITRDVSSDPNDPDTDGDGIEDGLERAFGLDPRDPDTDDDQLPDPQEINAIFSDPTNQDTDFDGLTDGQEFLTFKTSPLLDDSDGDQLLDGDEVVLGSRDPRISDVPIPRIRIGNVNLALDARFSFTDELGISQTSTESVSSTLSQSESDTFSTAEENATTATIGASTEIGAEANFPKGGGVSTKVGLSSGLEQGFTSSVGTESVSASEQAYEESLSTSATVDKSQSVTREVVGADMLVEVTVENRGDTAFTISNIEITALQQDAQDRSAFLPLASLKPQSELDALNLGPLGLVSNRGPFVFDTQQIFPDQVEDLLKNPRGLIFKLANFDITDESGRNFAFSSQNIFDRTAGITIDFGDGTLESYRVATNSTFDTGAMANGITVDYALQDILGLSTDDVIRDGGDRKVDTVASDDDVQVVALGLFAEPGEIVISAGPDGIVQSVPAGDDRLSGRGFETTAVMRDLGGEMQPVRILTRVREVQSGFSDDPLTPGGNTTDRVVDETRAFWVLFAEQPLDPAADFGDLVLQAGDQISLAFVQDKDSDGVFGREEFLYGSSDRNPNSDGCFDDDLATPEFDGSCDQGTYDLLLDNEEIKDGWLVKVERRAARRVYSDPVQPDSDGDRLLDHEERACGLDPRQRDTDLDGVNDFAELTGYQIDDGDSFVIDVPAYNGLVILDGGNGLIDTVADGDDITVAQAAVIPGGIIIAAGPNEQIDTMANNQGIDGDDFVAIDHRLLPECLFAANLPLAGYASDPLNADTDGDAIVDGSERDLGINPNNPLDGGAFRDADSDGVADLFETQGFETTVNGNVVLMFSDPFDPDTDNDRLPDLLEHRLGSDPMRADTDGDRLSDFHEFAGGSTCILSPNKVPCVEFSDAAYSDFLDDCALASDCSIDIGTSDRIGSNINERDTDNDGLLDDLELVPVTITVNGSPREVTFNIFDPNADGDGWNDGTERLRRTDPNDADTDNDGTTDDIEAIRGRNPAQQDRRVLLRYNKIRLLGDCESFLNGTGPGEFRWSFNFQTAAQFAAGTGPFSVPEWNQDAVVAIEASSSEVTRTLSQPATPIRFVADYTRQFRLQGFLQEIDSGSADGTLSFDKTYTVSAGLSSINERFRTTDPAGRCSNADWSVEAQVVVD